MLFSPTSVIDLLEQFNVAVGFRVYIVPGSQSDLPACQLGPSVQIRRKIKYISDICKHLGFYADIKQVLPSPIPLSAVNSSVTDCQTKY